MTNHYEAIIVGSGFGGSVMAYELAKAGMKVCILERGKAYPPGSFPRSPREVARNFWDPSKRLYGMFDIWSFRKSEAIVASGLGGGSLIYANVLIRKPSEWFNRELSDGTNVPWPVTYELLEPHYNEVEKMLCGQKFPLNRLPKKMTKKARAFASASIKVGLKTYQPLLAVTFANKGEPPRIGAPIHSLDTNLHNAPRETCRLCGECDFGCNYGSKNTLDFNYLSAAKRLGVDIKTMAEVRSFSPIEDDDSIVGYKVSFVQHDLNDKNPSSNLKLNSFTCDNLILAAGTLGTNYLLLKNHQFFPRISHKLGSGYSTNGDLLSFAIQCRDVQNQSKKPKILDPSCGPVITTTAEVKFSSGKGGHIQDAGYPEFLSWLVEVSNIRGNLFRIFRFIFNRIFHWLHNDPRSEIDAEISRLLGSARLSSTSLPLLAMGCDKANGQVRLRKSLYRFGVFLDIDWDKKSSSECFDTLSKTCKEVVKEMGGTFVKNPLNRFFKRIITVHPLGGCSMGMDINQGVVASNGEVFNYKNLYIADGSIMPAAVGTNPSLTIAAMSRHIAMGIIQQHMKLSEQEREH